MFRLSTILVVTLVVVAVMSKGRLQGRQIKYTSMTFTNKLKRQ